MMTKQLVPCGRTRLCRLCLTDKEDDLLPIFGGAIPDLAERIYDCTAVEINCIEGIPALICQLCRSKIVVCHQFVESCQRADRKFHRLYGSQFRQHKRFKREFNDGIADHQAASDSSCSSTDPKTAGVGKQLALPSSVPAPRIERNHVKKPTPVTVARLINDDKIGRHSIDDNPEQIEAKPVKIKRPRLSEDSYHGDSSMQLVAARIEQSLKNDEPNQEEDQVQSGRRKCPTCGLLVRNYQKHKKLHSTLRKHVCGICNKMFSKRCYLTYHANLHTGERPFKCDECGIGFHSPQKLKDHKLTHNKTSNDRREEEQAQRQCNVCHLVFSQNMLDKHMSTHQRERKYSCETCGNAYYTRTYLNKHKREVHGWTG